MVGNVTPRPVKIAASTNAMITANKTARMAIASALSHPTVEQYSIKSEEREKAQDQCHDLCCTRTCDNVGEMVGDFIDDREYYATEKISEHCRPHRRSSIGEDLRGEPKGY